MEKKQSSVEWLQKAIYDKLHMNSNKTYEYIINKAKSMHKEEIEEAWNDGCYQSSDFPKTSDAEKYYNETFGGQDERNSI